MAPTKPSSPGESVVKTLSSPKALAASDDVLPA